VKTRYGNLTPEEVKAVGGDVFYDCRCDCGRRRWVRLEALRSLSVRACEDCTRNRRSPPRPTKYRRLWLTLDADVMAALGLDPETVTAVQLRRRLRELTHTADLVYKRRKSR
jgi:hypothetical protein